MPREGVEDVRALVFAGDLPERPYLDRVRGSRPAAHHVWEVLEVNVRTGGQDTRPFDGVLELAQDGTYTLEVDAEFNGGGVTLTDEGNYSMAGNTIDFTPTGDPERMKDGTISGNAMTAETQFGGIPFEIDLSK